MPPGIVTVLRPRSPAATKSPVCWIRRLTVRDAEGAGLAWTVKEAVPPSELPVTAVGPVMLTVDPPPSFTVTEKLLVVPCGSTPPPTLVPSTAETQEGDRPRRSRPIAHPRLARTAMASMPSTQTVPHPSRIPPRTNRSMTEPIRLFPDHTIQNRTRRAGDARPLPFLGRSGRFGGIGLSPHLGPLSPSDDARDRRAFEAARFPPDSRRSCLPDRRSPEIPPYSTVPSS